VAITQGITVFSENLGVKTEGSQRMWPRLLKSEHTFNNIEGVGLPTPFRTQKARSLERQPG
jgi:hypothetical protein